eukprot:3759315-Amphidinium_carterae.1
MATLRCLFAGFVNKRVHNHYGSCCVCHEWHTGHGTGAAIIRGCYRPKLGIVRGLTWLQTSDPAIFVQLIVQGSLQRSAEHVD